MFGVNKVLKEYVIGFFKGNLLSTFFCAKANDEYYLFSRKLQMKILNKPAIESIEGCKYNDDLTRKSYRKVGNAYCLCFSTLFIGFLKALDTRECNSAFIFEQLRFVVCH